MKKYSEGSAIDKLTQMFESYIQPLLDDGWVVNENSYNGGTVLICMRYNVASNNSLLDVIGRMSTELKSVEPKLNNRYNLRILVSTHIDGVDYELQCVLLFDGT